MLCPDRARLATLVSVCASKLTLSLLTWAAGRASGWELLAWWLGILVVVAWCAWLAGPQLYRRRPRRRPVPGRHHRVVRHSR